MIVAGTGTRGFKLRNDNDGAMANAPAHIAAALNYSYA
jgi:hypothetical protein